MRRAFAQVINISSEEAELRFRSFVLRQIQHGHSDELTRAREIFPSACYGHWILERTYSHVSDYGQLASDIEDTLLLLRLFKPGDLAFLSHVLREPDGRTGTQHAYGAVSELTGPSTFRYELSQSECDQWDSFADEITACAAWRSAWFQVSRRFFLYGGGKPFDPTWNEVDRVVDYMTALEAALVWEDDFVGRRLRQRAAALVREACSETHATVPALIRDFYDVRCRIVHGGVLTDKHRILLQEKRREFEAAVRTILVAALRTLPKEEDARRIALVQSYDVTDEDRSKRVLEDFRRIKSDAARRTLLDRLAKE